MKTNSLKLIVRISIYTHIIPESISDIYCAYIHTVHIIIIITSSGAKATGGSCGHKLQPGMKSKTTDQAPQGGKPQGARQQRGRRGRRRERPDRSAGEERRRARVDASEPERTNQAQAKPSPSARTAGRHPRGGVGANTGEMSAKRQYPAPPSHPKWSESHRARPGRDTSATPQGEGEGR